MIVKHSMTRAVIWHLGSGLPASLMFLWLALPAREYGLPPLLPFMVGVLTVMVPLQVMLMMRASHGEAGPLLPYRRPLSKTRMAMVTTGCLVWAVLAFVLLEPVLARPLKNEFFAWWPRMLTLGDYLHNPEHYSRQVRLLTWSVGLLASFIVPISEELYFRGYLMPRLPLSGIMVPMVSTILFVLYHFWSPWLFLVRIIAVFPLYYYTWRLRNIYPAVIVHVLLNLVGDTLTTIPIVFAE